MTTHAATSARTQALPLAVGRSLLWVLAICTLAGSTGCSQLRLPAIDSTGSSLFAPKPISTTLAIPGGERLRQLGDRLRQSHDSPAFQFPTPAFVEPAEPPPCPVAGPTLPAPTTVPVPTAPNTEPYVPSSSCTTDCQEGPPSVFYGSELIGGRRFGLPTQGKRGCILLTPQKVVVPVGGEVILLSGICGKDGYLQVHEKLEWMLTPDSVGTIIEVGDDAPGLISRVAAARQRPKKIDPSYAVGRTSTKRMLITRGNLDTRDDVLLEKGQTWISLSSPTEGTSHVTVLAPESECWDQRKATATIYWVDARWQFPTAELVPAGQPVELTTRVTRSEGTLPARGWKVRYEILQPELASFAGTDGSSVAEAIVDESGNAVVQLVPNPGTSGVAAIDIQVIRPGGDRDNIPTLTLGRGQTLVTWSAPQLAIRAGAPSVATYNETFQVAVNLSNPGDQAANNVRVDVQLPPGAQATSPDSFARVLPNAVSWEIGALPPQQQLDLFLDVTAQAPVDLIFQARGDGLVAEDSVRIDVFRPSLSVAVASVEDRVEAGEPVTFNIDVTNRGDRPLANLALTVTGDDGMMHEGGDSTVGNRKENGPLQPGETWGAQVVFQPTRSGRRCVTVEATADGGQRAISQACVTVINPVQRNPRLTANLQGPNQAVVGQRSLFRARLANTGDAMARSVTASMTHVPQLRLSQATEGANQPVAGQIVWSIPAIEPGQEILLEAEFDIAAVAPRARVALTAQCADSPTAATQFDFQIIPAAPAARPEPQPPNLPPANPPPEIPGGPAPQPLSGPPPRSVTPAGPTVPQVSDRLQARLFLRDIAARANEDIRYALRIINDSRQRDGEVLIQFELPDGVGRVRVNPLTNPELGEIRVDEGLVTLAPIRSMEPGESIEYELVLQSNQPQTFDLNLLIRSQRMRNGFEVSATTTVLP